jgi:RNA polymerase sigma-70 factor (ECF subfamily)
MDNTQMSLLLRAQDGEEGAWRRVVDLYQPLIRSWLIHQGGVRDQEAEDLTQDVLAAIVKNLKRFEHNGRPGAFRSWLRTITVNRAREFWRAGKCRDQGTGGDAFLDWVNQLEEPDSPLTRLWDEEHDRHVLARLLALLDEEFEPSTVTAFRRTTFDGAAPRDVATEMGMSVAAVYGAKARVLQRLRQEAAGLID